MEKHPIKYKLSDIITVINNKKNQPLYDMYQLAVMFNNGEKQVIKVFCKHDTIDLKEVEPRVKRFFFIDRVFGKNGQKGLIDIQKRDDYIFLGELTKSSDGHYSANRFYEMPGKQINAEKYFNDNYHQIKQALERAQKKEKVDGKNYAMSDIHGMYGSYMEAIKTLNEKDTLFIIGDVIDRGKNGIAILQDIMSRQEDGNKPRIVFFLGNHEILMMESLDIIKRHNLNEEEIEKICEVGNTAKQIMEELPHLQLEDGEIEMLYKWLKREQGQVTFDAYRALPQNEQDSIYEFLLHANIFGQKEINNKKVLFVHAAPYPNQSVVDIFKNTGEAFYKCSNEGNIEGRNKILGYCLQERDCEDAFKIWKDSGYLTIYGHTPNDGKIKKDEENGCICIDCGCGHKNESSKLALYCIEDETVQLLDEKENDTVNPQDVGETR